MDDCPNCRMMREVFDNLSQPYSAESPTPANKSKRKPSAYNAKYSKAFKKVSPRYKTKSGSWRKNGFKQAQKAAHKMAKGMK